MAAIRSVRDLLTRALRIATVVGAGETPDSDDMSDALLSFNLMLDAWQAERLLVYSIVEQTAPLVAGTSAYNIGTGATINVPRPVRIEWAFTRDASNYDRWIDIQPDNVFAQIILKTLGNTFPVAMYYQPSYPIGVINLWPVPPAALTLHFGAWTVLTEYTDLTTTVSLPPGYEDAIVFSMAERVCPEYGRTCPPDLARLAMNARANIQQNNLPDQRVVCEFTGIGVPQLTYADYVAGNF